MRKLKRLATTERQTFEHYEHVSDLIIGYCEVHQIKLEAATVARLENLDNELQRHPLIQSFIWAMPNDKKDQLLNILVDSFSITDVVQVFQKLLHQYTTDCERELAIIAVLKEFFQTAQLQLTKKDGISNYPLLE